MKKVILILIAVVLFAASCHWPHNSITVSDGQSYLKIEYTGTVVFSDDNTRIIRISPGGYFKCKNDYDKLSIESDNNGTLIYEVNGDEMPALNAAGKALMQQAAREIAKQHGKKRV